MIGRSFHAGAAAALLLLLAGCATSPGPMLSASHQPPRYEARLKPMVGDDGEVSAIAVDAVIYGSLDAGAEALRLTAPVVYAGAYGIADRITRLTVTDHRGRVEMEHEDDAPSPGGFPYFRHWQAGRQVVFPVRVSWQVAVEQYTDSPGPPFNIRPSAGGVSGAGSGFLVIPENVTTDETRVSWDFADFGTAAVGISSFGEGAFELLGPAAALWQGWYMAGPLGRYPDAGDANGFSAAWLGDFPFDAGQAMHSVSDAYAWLGRYFGYLDPPPRYRVFMRIIDSSQTRFSGTALGASFMLSGGPDSGQDSNNQAPTGTFFHEMIHMWVGGVEGPQGVSSWFAEGLTSYYTLVLPLRGGFESVEEYGRNIDFIAERYYTSPALGMSAADIAAVGFGSEKVRRTPYDRGLMYFADLDARIRERSNGQRGLDDLMREIFERRHNDPAYVFDHAAWTIAVTAELGSEAAAEFQARILDGEPIAPASAAFGPCFERELTRYSVDDKYVPGYRWVRVAGVPDDQCAGE